MERIWLNAPGWGRAGLVANTPVADPVSMALDDTGHVYLFLYAGDESGYFPRVMAMNRQAEVVWERTYEIALERPDQSRILWDGQALQLFWLSAYGLYNAQVETQSGQLLASPVLLSDDVEVASYAVAQDTNGTIAVWYAGTQERPGLYALPPGDLSGQAVEVDARGIGPHLRYDETGTLHAAWASYLPGQDHPRFLYAAYQDGRYVPGQESVLLEPRVGTSRVYGPWLGLDPQNVYLLWTIVPRLGPMAGMAGTYYLYFPRGQPALASASSQVSIPYAYRLAYTTFPGQGLEAGPRVILGSSHFGNTYLSELFINPALAPEQVVAFHTRLEYLRRKEQGQVSIVFFQGGIPAGYQQISFTPASSGLPAILSDQGGYLYITWLVSGAESGYDVYFSSTAPDVRQALGKVTWGDIGQLGAETVFGLLAGVVLTPLALAWIVAPLLVLGLTSLLRRKDERFTSPGVLASLVLAIGAYWISKLALMPTIRDYVPFSAWLPFIPPAFGLPLQVLTPLLITGLALMLAWRYTYAQDRPSPFFFLAIYAAVDAILTMAVYGVTFYGAF
ncbi:MAG: hypothetical protein Kow0063_03540 [Anaerolineae bacterium]